MLVAGPRLDVIWPTRLLAAPPMAVTPSTRGFLPITAVAVSLTKSVGLSDVIFSCTLAARLVELSGMIVESGLAGDACHLDGESARTFEEISSTLVIAPLALR